MMKWGSKKKKSTTSSASSSSHSSSTSQSLISNAFSRSWFSRFKNVKGSSESKEVNVKRVGKGKGSCVAPNSGVSSDEWDGGRFYGRDDDSCWSLSFRKDRLKGEVGKCGLKPGQCNSDDELQFSPLHVVSQRRMARESSYGKVESRTRKTKGLKHQKPEEESRRIWEEGKEFQRKSDKGRVSFERSVEKDVFEVKLERINSQKNSRRQHRISFSNSIDLGTIKEDCIFEGLSSASEQSDTFSEDGLSQIRKNKKASDMILRNENQKASSQLRKERQRRRMRMKQSRKVKVCSPRSAAKIECKIKALEDMKRAKMMKTKKMMVKDETVKNTTNFDSYAVVKCSVDPEGDFRESMVEMIREKGIRRAEVLEELLACYLTLNSGEYHDLIVKVFREVWLELNQAQFNQELDIMNCGYL